MEKLTCRLLPFAVAGGSWNMAADEVLLRAAAGGQASLRFYGWSTATLSLGYFQPEARRHEVPLLADLPYVRRPTGGSALVHHRELTYCLALPSTLTRQTGETWLRMHEIIAAALAKFGIKAYLFEPSQVETPTKGASYSGFLCFHQLTAGDLMIGAAKVAGSAQRKQRYSVMQHGGILLARSSFTPSLPGIRDLTGVEVQTSDLIEALVQHLRQRLAWRIEPAEWTENQLSAIAELVQQRYASEAWNRRR